MTNETENTFEAAAANTVETNEKVGERRSAVVAEYMEMFKKEDLEGCKEYIAQCFGEIGTESFDEAGVQAFAQELDDAMNPPVEEAKEVETDATES